jgi:hypothetical protein
MGPHVAVSEQKAGLTRRAGVLFLGAVVSGALAVGALSQAPEANATCLSVSGLTIGKGCTSTFGDMAVAIGSGATASATGGLFGDAFALGNSASATATNAVLGVAFAVGPFALTNITGVATAAVALGPGDYEH